MIKEKYKHWNLSFDVIEDIIIIGEFTDKNNGDKFTREEWLKCVNAGDFIPSDGSLGEIIIDNKLTTYQLAGWEFGFPFITFEEKHYQLITISLQEFLDLNGNIEVMWYNK